MITIRFNLGAVMRHVLPLSLTFGATFCTAGISAAASALPANDPLQNEISLETQAHAAAFNDAPTATTRLMVAGTFVSPIAPSILLARRAVFVCGWLQNENKYGAAAELAANVEQKLSAMQEANSADHEERLYWEAVLVGRMLDQKKNAIALLESAKAIAPDDDRVLDLDLEFTSAVAEFGK